MSTKKGYKGIETRSIDYVPPNERYGHPSNQFTLWYGVELNAMVLGTGAYLPLLGFNMAWSIVAIIGGLLIGGIFFAFHSAQGPHLGIPQMIQSRAQFGVIGAILPLILACIIFAGYYTSTLNYGAEAIATPFHIPKMSGLLIAAIGTVIICVYGYELIHKAQKVASVLGTIVFAALTYSLFKNPLPPEQWSLAPMDLGTFLLGMSVFITFLVIGAPYVADYSRYLPENTSIKSSFLYTYGGAVIGTGWVGCIGAYISILRPDLSDNVTGITLSYWPLGLTPLVFGIFLLTAVCSCTVSMYGTFMAVVTTLAPFTSVKGSKKSKILIMSCVAILGVTLNTYFTNMVVAWATLLTILLYFMIPWTSINLVDYYFVRKGNYSLPDIFDVNGIYGRVNKSAMITYFTTIIIQIPFMYTTVFEGPLAVYMNGADLAWLVGGVLSAVMFYVLNLDLAKAHSWKDSGMKVNHDEFVAEMEKRGLGMTGKK